MAKFGLFSGASITPMQEIEGDYLDQEGPIVKVFKKLNADGGARQVGAFNLDKNQTVKEEVRTT